MKKLISIVLVIATLFAMSITASAHDYEHEHDWDFYTMGDTIELCCDCGSSISIPLDPTALACHHKFEEYQNSNFHGRVCTKCHFGIHDKHSWEIEYETIENGQYSHEAVCVDCGYKATHKLVSYHDDTHHYITCRKCKTEEIHDLSYSYDRYCHEVKCEHCSYTIFEAHTFNEDDICIKCEILTGMVTGQHTEFDDDGDPIENQFYVLINGDERMFIIDEYPDNATVGDIVTFVTDGEYVDEIIDVISADNIDEEEIFVVEDDEDLEWLWWNDFHAVNYDTTTHNTENGQIVSVDVELGDEIFIITPENPLQNTIYLIVN